MIRSRHEGPFRLIAALTALVLMLCLWVGYASSALGEEEEVAGVASTEVLIGDDPHKRYFFITAEGDTVEGDASPPPKGYGLVIVLPGGDGGADFQPFVKRIFKNTLSNGYVAAQPVAVKWTADQKIIWPTRVNRVAGCEFTTEEFVAAVREDIGSRVPIDDRRVFTLSWSSGGPAAYAVALQDKTPVTGSYVAMSVFMPHGLPLAEARGHAFFFDHSPEDETCRFWHARKAESTLARMGAATNLVSYDGGHGWHGDVFGRLRDGFAWLEKNAGKKAAAPDKVSRKARKGNLLFNGGFEEGTEGWMVVNNSGRLQVESDGKQKKEGKRSLRLDKTGGPPFDLLRNDIFGIPECRRIEVTARIKAESAERGFLKFFLYDAAGESLEQNVDVFMVSGSFSSWKSVDKVFDVPEGAASAAVMFLMIGEGTVWLDDVRVQIKS